MCTIISAPERPQKPCVGQKSFGGLMSERVGSRSPGTGWQRSCETGAATVTC